jgi:hypothetical protein
MAQALSWWRTIKAFWTLSKGGALSLAKSM